MFYALTLNPSVDYDMFLRGSIGGGGEVNQAVKTAFRASGKGINVAKMFRELGEPCEVIGLVGGFTGRFIREELERLGIAYDFVEVEGDTRVNVKVRRGGERGSEEEEITGVAPTADSAVMAALSDRLGKVRAGDTLILTGSLPVGTSATIYREIAERLPDGVTTALDTRGSLLAGNIYKNFLIKPNAAELAEMFADSESGSVIELAEKARLFGAENVLATLGGDGAAFVGEGGVFAAKPPEGELVQSMGAGDSCVAGFLFGKSRGMSDSDAFKLAVSCGSATAFSPDMGSKALVWRLFEMVKVEEIRRRN